MLIVIIVLLLWVIYTDIKNRQILNSSLLAILVSVIIYAYPREIINSYSFLWAIFVLFIGVFLSVFHVVGAGDSKLLAILLFGIKPENLILVPFSLAILIVISIIIFRVVSMFKPEHSVRGLPLAPAISLAGLLCIWL
ncbi:prepilin peptidase [Celerinatantimonas sp. YJH-8]|uniref:prepilin peptidase n=1 Tax=Celerinatantimonas sp. YJH-8 TaxID=3228714 RepID=UPI0038C0C937